MITKVQKWGNSQGLRLSKQLLADVEMDVGDDVNVAVRDGTLVVTPVRRVRGAVDLEQLVRRIPKGYKRERVEWGTPVGREVW
ncbi:MAG TPA: transcriptional regulator/antitoxin, MazE [Acidobacteriota bacterium]